MTDIDTYFFYFVISLLCLLLTNWSQRSRRLLGIILATILLSLISGLRAYDVGIDTILYKFGTEFFFETGVVSWQYNFSYGYGILSKFILTINNDYTFLLLFEAFLTNSLIIARIWDYRDVGSLTFMLFIYICTTYFITMNIICQYISIAIVFFFSRYLDRNRPIVFCIGAAIASLIHISAIIALVLWLVRLINFKNVSPVRFFIQLVFLGLVLFAFFNFAPYLIERYSIYNSASRASSVGFMVFAQVIVLLISLLSFGFFSRHCDNSLRSSFKNRAPYCLTYYSISLILTSTSYVITNAGRIGYYFSIYGPICFGIMVKQGISNRTNLAFQIFLIAWFFLYTVYTFFIVDRLGIIPYSFIWG